MANTPFIWITGASSGIGKSLTEVLLTHERNVFGTSRREIELPSNSHNGIFLPFASDIKKASDVKKAVDFLSTDGRYIDCLINNAGITSFKPAEKDSLDDVSDIIQTNLLGSIYAIKSVLPDMIKRNSGTIVNILSAVTHKVFAYSSTYSASKAGLLAYTDVLREEVRKYNIRVINIIPGATATPIWSDKILQEKSDRMMKPEEVASLIADLLLTTNSVVPEEIRLKPILGDL